MTGRGSDVLGVRLARNGPVLFVKGDGGAFEPGDRVLVDLAGGGRQEARVAVGSGQMLRGSPGRLVGRVVGRAPA